MLSGLAAQINVLQSFASQSLGDLGQGGSLWIHQPEQGLQAGSENAIFGREVFICEATTLIDEARRPEGVCSGIDRAWRRVHHRPSILLSDPPATASLEYFEQSASPPVSQPWQALLPPSAASGRHRSHSVQIHGQMCRGGQRARPQQVGAKRSYLSEVNIHLTAFCTFTALVRMSASRRSIASAFHLRTDLTNSKHRIAAGGKVPMANVRKRIDRWRDPWRRNWFRSKQCYTVSGATARFEIRPAHDMLL
jgi:hypothetical protein